VNHWSVVAAVMLGLLLGRAPQAWAGQPLLPGEKFAVGSGPSSVALADLDGGSKHHRGLGCGSQTPYPYDAYSHPDGRHNCSRSPLEVFTIVQNGDRRSRGG